MIRKAPGRGKRTAVEREHNVAEMAEEVARHQAGAHARRTREMRGKDFSADADARPRSLREDPCREKGADGWREGITRRRAGERAEASGWRSRRETPSTPACC